MVSFYYFCKYCFFMLLFKRKKTYTVEDLPSLRGVELQYLSNTLCMKVYIAAADKRGITLMGRWWDSYEGKYEKEDSVIYCINAVTEQVDMDAFLDKINDAIHTRVWYNQANTKSYFGGRVDDKCAFSQ